MSERKFVVEITTDDPDFDFRDIRKMLDYWLCSYPEQFLYDWELLVDPDQKD